MKIGGVEVLDVKEESEDEQETVAIEVTPGNENKNTPSYHWELEAENEPSYPPSAKTATAAKGANKNTPSSPQFTRPELGERSPPTPDAHPSTPEMPGWQRRLLGVDSSDE